MPSEARREQQRAAYAANPEPYKARARARYAAFTPEQLEAKAKASADARRGNPQTLDRRKASQLRLRQEVIVGYGGECACCANSFLPHLTLDHVNGGGNEARRSENARVTYARLRRLLREGVKDISFQVLCWNCNLAKHHYGKCECGGEPL